MYIVFIKYLGSRFFLRDLEGRFAQSLNDAVRFETVEEARVAIERIGISERYQITGTYEVRKAPKYAFTSVNGQEFFYYQNRIHINRCIMDRIGRGDKYIFVKGFK